MADSDLALRRRKALRRGRTSEYVAALFLMLKGYRIAALRYRTKLGEIDIVARKGDLAVFVEVKARRDEAGAVDAVSFAAQRRIRAASDLPVCVGFGIRTPEQAAAIAAIADGAVVGSAIVGRIADTAGQPRDKILAAVLELTGALAASTHHAKVSA